MIRKAKLQDADILTELARSLWPCHGAGEMEEEIRGLLLQEEAAFFLAFEGQECIGFAQCKLRHDYVEGTSTSPVGYLEGIYVKDAFRGKGTAGALLSRCEAWAKELGCAEFASDCELGNTRSLHFHLKLGFEEANRIVCFVKKL